MKIGGDYVILNGLKWDMSNFKDGDMLKVSDIKVPDYVDVLEDMDMLVASIAHPRVEAEPAEGVEAAEVPLVE